MPSSKLLAALATLALVALLAIATPGPASGSVTARDSVDSAHAQVGGVPGASWTTYHGSENRSGWSQLSGPRSGDVAWTSCLTSQRLRVGPISDGARVYVGGDLGTIFAVNNTVEGPEVWNLTLPAPPTQMDLDGGTLLVGTTGGALYAINSSDGAIAWRLLLGSPIVQGLAVDGGDVLVPTASGSLEAFAVADGAAAWSATLAGPAGGAPAVELGIVYVVTANGSLEALGAGGTELWSASVGAPVATAPAVAEGRVLVGDTIGRVSAYRSTNGSLLWRWVTPDRLGDSLHATPAVDATRVYLETDNGETVALNASDGLLEWRTPGEYSPFVTTAAPVIAPGALYAVVNGLDSVVAFAPGNGTILWQTDVLYSSYSSPALVNGQLLVGSDVGCLFDFGPSGPPFPWSVSGTVSTTNGTPLAGARLTFANGSTTVLTNASGGFATALSNGSWSYALTDYGFVPDYGTVLVSGAAVRLDLTLTALFFYEIRGLVVDAYDGRPIAGAPVQLTGPYDYATTTVSGANGSFELSAPNGTNLLEVGPVPGSGPSPGNGSLATSQGPGYRGTSLAVVVAGASVAVSVRLFPLGGTLADETPYGAAAWLPLVAIALALAVVAVRELSRRRVASGLPPALLSPFGQYVVRRLLLLPAQLFALLAVLYFVSNVLVHPVAGCGHDPLCVGASYFSGLGHFLELLFTGQWGYVTYGPLREPTTTLLAWWIPNSIELAAVALPLSAAIAYPLGLLSGWRPGSATDEGSRVASISVMTIPTIVVVLLLFAALDEPFYRTFGDLPVGLTPSNFWFADHGGFPSWWVFGGTTRPTGFPLVDGILHGDGPFVLLVVSKLLLQALSVAIVYVAVFLRHARNATAQVAREVHLTAARARGVPERTLLWRHARRRVLPLYVLIFSLTIPTYLGTQAVVEVLFGDAGFGTLLFYEITHIAGYPLGFSGALGGNFYQVALLVLLLTILFTVLAADVVGRYLDPRARSSR